MFGRAMPGGTHPILAQIIPIRRCNLDCNEYDKVLAAVPIAAMLRRIDKPPDSGCDINRAGCEPGEFTGTMATIPALNPEENGMGQDNATIIRRFADEVITGGKIDSAAQYVWEDVVEQVPLPGQGPGLDGLKDILRVMRAGFPDIVFSIQEQITEGNKVASRFEWTGTHKGEFLGIPATERHVRVWGIVIDRLENGRIKDTRIIMDTLGLMTQLGALPSSPA